MTGTEYLNSTLKRSNTTVYRILNSSNSEHICYVRIPNRIFILNMSHEDINVDDYFLGGIHNTRDKLNHIYKNLNIFEKIGSNRINAIKVDEYLKDECLSKVLVLNYISSAVGCLYQWNDLIKND